MANLFEVGHSSRVWMMIKNATCLLVLFGMVCSVCLADETEQQKRIRRKVSGFPVTIWRNVKPTNERFRSETLDGKKSANIGQRFPVSRPCAMSSINVTKNSKMCWCRMRNTANTWKTVKVNRRRIITKWNLQYSDAFKNPVPPIGKPVKNARKLYTNPTLKASNSLSTTMKKRAGLSQRSGWIIDIKATLQKSAPHYCW